MVKRLLVYFVTAFAVVALVQWAAYGSNITGILGQSFCIAVAVTLGAAWSKSLRHP